ncbi:MAG: AAA family ATPase [Myxococcota bacterium]
MTLFQKARRTDSRLRLALLGPAGSGKTFTALRIAHGLIGPDQRQAKLARNQNSSKQSLRESDQRFAVIDTEHASSNLYADEINPDGGTFDFDVLDLAAMPGAGKYSVEKYLAAIRAAAEAEYPVLILDSLSHAWAGEGGLLDFVHERTIRSKTKNSFAGWRDATPLHNRLIEAILSYPGHVIATLRTKVQWVVEQDAKGQSVPRKVGLQPIQREGLDYEFTVVADVDPETHTMVVTKTRCAALVDRSFPKAGADVADVLTAWLDGAEAPPYDVETFKEDCEGEGFEWDEVVWYVNDVQGKSPSELNAAQLTTLIDRLRATESRDRFLAAVKGLRDRFRRTFFARMGQLEAFQDQDRRVLVRLWYEADSIREVPLARILHGDRGLDWLRSTTAAELREAVKETFESVEVEAMDLA